MWQGHLGTLLQQQHRLFGRCCGLDLVESKSVRGERDGRERGAPQTENGLTGMEALVRYCFCLLRVSAFVL